MPPTIDDEFDDFDLDDPDLLAAVDQIEKDYKAPRKPVAGAAPKASVSAPGRALSVPQAKKPVQTRGVALPKQPVYEDEFPPVQLDANGTYKKWVDPKDAERTQLQAQVAEVSAVRAFAIWRLICLAYTSSGKHWRKSGSSDRPKREKQPSYVHECSSLPKSRKNC